MTVASKNVFETSEYTSRLASAQTLMKTAGLDGLLLTTEPEVRYFTGFLTRFWESPSRPWFLIVPQSGKPIAVIPSIGTQLMSQTWITDIRTWRSPNLKDDGVSLLRDTIIETIGKSGKLGVPGGHETHLRMPLDDFDRLVKSLANVQILGDAGIMRQLRMVKSAAEIAIIKQACQIGNAAFARVGEFAMNGAKLDDVFRKFQMTCLDEGADWVPYLAGGAGKNGYRDVISPATSQELINGDVLMLDTGLVKNGYFCDFDRNFSIGKPSNVVKNAQLQLMDAVDAGMETAKPGARACDLFKVMNNVVGNDDADETDAGRLGHGLGMQLTEWPSLIAADETVLQEGMVLTLEPSVQTEPGKIMVHEENIAITDQGAQFLTKRAGNNIIEL